MVLIESTRKMLTSKGKKVLKNDVFFCFLGEDLKNIESVIRRKDIKYTQKKEVAWFIF